jgi:hypothetical protein
MVEIRIRDWGVSLKVDAKGRKNKKPYRRVSMFVNFDVRDFDFCNHLLSCLEPLVSSSDESSQDHTASLLASFTALLWPKRLPFSSPLFVKRVSLLSCFMETLQPFNVSYSSIRCFTVTETKAHLFMFISLILYFYCQCLIPSVHTRVLYWKLIPRFVTVFIGPD